jgi:hypothetical protein
MAGNKTSERRMVTTGKGTLRQGVRNLVDSWSIVFAANSVCHLDRNQRVQIERVPIYSYLHVAPG